MVYPEATMVTTIVESHSWLSPISPNVWCGIFFFLSLSDLWCINRTLKSRPLCSLSLRSSWISSRRRSGLCRRLWRRWWHENRSRATPLKPNRRYEYATPSDLFGETFVSVDENYKIIKLNVLICFAVMEHNLKKKVIIWCHISYINFLLLISSGLRT